MSAWFAFAENILPDISSWHVFLQALVTIFILLVTVAIFLGIVAGSAYGLLRMTKDKRFSEAAGVLGYSVVVFFGWATFAFLPLAIGPGESEMMKTSDLVQSFAIFFPIFLLLSLLAKDQLQGYKYWKDSEYGEFAKLFEVSLLILPLGIPFFSRLMALKKEEMRKTLVNMFRDF